MAKRHFAVSYPHVNHYADGRAEYVTLYEAVCHHSGPQPNATTREEDVTCQRCRAYLGFDGHHPSPERYRIIAQEDYGSDDLEIDAKARISQADDGAWVAAWVWVADPQAPEEEDA